MGIKFKIKCKSVFIFFMFPFLINLLHSNHALSETEELSFLVLQTKDQVWSEDELLQPLELSVVVSGKLVKTFSVVSGKPGNQFFRFAEHSVADSDEPIPEAIYSIGRLRDYGSSEHPRLPGIARFFLPVFFSIGTKVHSKNPRTSLGIHVDRDKANDPGTAGCIGLESRKEMRQLIRLIKKYQIKKLIVDYFR